jgi:hypothetical protein
MATTKVRGHAGWMVSASPDGLWRGGRQRYVVVALEGAKVEEPTKEREGVVHAGRPGGILQGRGKEGGRGGEAPKPCLAGKEESDLDRTGKSKEEVLSSEADEPVGIKAGLT